MISASTLAGVRGFMNHEICKADDVAARELGIEIRVLSPEQPGQARCCIDGAIAILSDFMKGRARAFSRLKNLADIATRAAVSYGLLAIGLVGVPPLIIASGELLGLLKRRAPLQTLLVWVRKPTGIIATLKLVGDGSRRLERGHRLLTPFGRSTGTANDEHRCDDFQPEGIRRE